MLYLLRPGDAGHAPQEGAARRLTEKGELQARAAGAALMVLGAELDACLTSPKVRAAETARLACEQLNGVEAEVTPELAGGFDSLALAAGRGDLLLVG